MYLIVLCFVIILCVLCYVLWDTYFNRKPTDPPEISQKLPLIGHSHLFIGSCERLFNTVTGISKECIEKGGVLKGSVGFRTIYVVTDPEDCLTVSNACVHKDLIYDFLKPILGEGLLTGNGSMWKKHRKLLNPTFSQPKLNNFIGVFNSQSRRLVEQMSEMIGRPFNHELLLRLNNLETICITASGLTSDDKEVQQKYLTCLADGLTLIIKRFRSFWLHNDFIYSFTDLKRRQEKIIDDFVKLSDFMVQKKKRDMKRNDRKETEEESSFLNYILELSETTGCFTDEEIREEINSLIAAGHDSTANILTCALILLGSHLDVQDKVYEEIKKVVGDTERDVSKDDLSELVYAEAVLKETLRLYPLTPAIARYVDREVKLKNCTLQPNNGIFISVWGLHRDPIWGPDAHEFKPERWLNTDTLPDMNYFAGFGLGRRGCIGKVYAMMSMKITLVHIVRKFKLSSDISKMRMKLEFLATVSAGDHLTISPRIPVFIK